VACQDALRGFRDGSRTAHDQHGAPFANMRRVEFLPADVIRLIAGIVAHIVSPGRLVIDSQVFGPDVLVGIADNLYVSTYDASQLQILHCRFRIAVRIENRHDLLVHVASSFETKPTF
jgi:hypothetical protein